MPKQSSYYEHLACQITEFLGGKKNIVSVTHCTTRLRVKLKKIPNEAIEKITNLSDVISVMNSGGVVQIVVGTKVEEVYQYIAPNIEAKNTHYYINSLLHTIIEIFTPILWILSVAGIMKGLLFLFGNIGWLDVDTGTYRILFSASDSIFFFLPIFLGYTSSKVLGGNPLFGIAIGGALVHPDIIQQANSIFYQEINGIPSPTEYFLGLPIQYVNYSASVIPILFATWFNVKLEKITPTYCPEVITKMIRPLLCLAITVPITFLVIGPLSTLFAKSVAEAILYLYHVSPGITGFLVGALWQVLVVIGIHWSLFPIAISNIAVTGYDVISPLLMPAIFGQFGACLGVLIRNWKDKKIRGYVASASLTAMFGVTEPAIYGVNLPRKWPFIFGCVSASLGSCIIALFHVKSFSLGVLSLFSFAQFIPHNGYDTSVTASILATLMTIILAVILTYLFTPDVRKQNKNTEIDDIESYNEEDGLGNHTKIQKVLSPLQGTPLPLSLVEDTTFASEIIGQGIAIRPESGILRAPFDGKVESVFRTRHSICLVSNQGVELLIHIGLETVKLQGKGFELLISPGETFITGQELIKFDLEFLIENGFDTTTPILVTNCTNYLDIIATHKEYIEYGEPLLTLI